MNGAAQTSISPQLDLSSFRALGATKARRVIVNPENSDSITLAGMTQDVYFALPSASFSMILGGDSNFVFDTVSSIDATAFSNGSASSVIRSIELIINNVSVELLDSYNVFAALVEDMEDRNRKFTSGNLLSGHSEGTVKTGADLLTVKNRFSIPIYSSAIGTLASQMMVSIDGIRLKVVFETADNCLVFATPATKPTITLSNVHLSMTYVDVAPAIFQQIVREGGGVLKCHGTGVSNFTNTTSGATTQLNLLIPARFQSVKALLTTFRLSSNVGDYRRNSVGARYNPNLRTYVYKIDGRQFPASFVNGSDGTTPSSGEVYTELLKCFGGNNSGLQQCVFKQSEYLDVVGTANQGSYAIGHDFEVSTELGNTINGIDLVSSNTFLEVASSSPTVGPLTINTFALYDSIVEVDMVSQQVAVSK